MTRGTRQRLLYAGALAALSMAYLLGRGHPLLDASATALWIAVVTFVGGSLIAVDPDDARSRQSDR